MILIRKDTSFIDFNKPSDITDYLISDEFKLKLIIKNKISNKELEYDINIINSDNRLMRGVLDLTEIEHGFYKYNLYLKNKNTLLYDDIEVGILMRSLDTKSNILDVEKFDDDSDFILTL